MKAEKPTAELESLTVVIGKRKIKLTLAEARELKKVLNATLEPKVESPAKIIERGVEKEAPVSTYPWRQGPYEVTPHWDPARIICETKATRHGQETARLALEDVRGIFVS